MSVRLAHGIGEAPRTSPVAAVVALGANLGERAETLAAAVAELRALPLTVDVTVSAPIETVAVTLDGEDDDAPRYLNAVATLRTRLAPRRCSPPSTASRRAMVACVANGGATARSTSTSSPTAPRSSTATTSWSRTRARTSATSCSRRGSTWTRMP